MHLSPFPYLDPGSGSIIIQVAIAALLGLAVVLRSSWSKIKGFFGKKQKSEDNEDDENNAN